MSKRGDIERFDPEIKQGCGWSDPGPCTVSMDPWETGDWVKHSDHLKRVQELEAQLAECYRLTGADPDGDSDSMLARYAVREVQRLRQEFDEEEGTMEAERNTYKRQRDKLITAIKAHRTLNPDKLNYEPEYARFDQGLYDLAESIEGEEGQ